MPGNKELAEIKILLETILKEVQGYKDKYINHIAVFITDLIKHFAKVPLQSRQVRDEPEYYKALFDLVYFIVDKEPRLMMKLDEDTRHAVGRLKRHFEDRYNARHNPYKRGAQPPVTRFSLLTPD